MRKGVSARVIARVGSTALRKGMHSGNRGLVLRRGRRHRRSGSCTSTSGRTEEIFTIKLRPGESLEIREIRRDEVGR